MKRLCTCFCAFGLVLCLIAAALPHFSAFADSESPFLYVYTSTSNNSSASPPASSFGSSIAYNVSPFTSVAAGAHDRIDKFTIHCRNLTSETIFLRVDFTVVAFRNQGNPPTITDFFPVSINGYQSNHATSISITDANGSNAYSAKCYQYLLGSYLGDFGQIFVPGYTEQTIFRGNKTLSFLLEITCPTNPAAWVSLTLDTPVTFYHTQNREDTLYLIPTNISQYVDISQALFAYIVDMRNDISQGEYDLAGIWQFLEDHSQYLDNLQYIDDILYELTSDTQGYIYRILDYVQLTRWYVSLMVASNYQVRYIDQNGVLATRTGHFWDSIIAELQLLNLDIAKSYHYQTEIDDMSTECESGDNSLQMALDAVSDANSIGSITGFLSIFNIAENDPEALTTHGTTGLLFWFQQINYDDLQQVPIPRGPLDNDDWVMPYTDKVTRMIEDLEGGD